MLTLEENAPPPSDKTDGSDTLYPDAKTACVLLVDDDHHILHTLSDFLKCNGFSVQCADNGIHARQLLNKRTPVDILLCDLKMPEMDGLQLLTTAKKIDPGIEVIMMTGYGEYDLAMQALKIGAADYFDKPVSTEEMLLSINKCMEKRRLYLGNLAYQQSLEDLIWQRTKDLQRSEAKFRTLVENSFDIIYALNPDGGFTFVNDEITNTLGYHQDDIISTNYKNLIHPEDLERVGRIFSERRTGVRASKWVEARLRKKFDHNGSGKYCPVEIKATGLYDQQGVFLGTQGTIRDITDRKGIEESLKENEEKYSALFNEAMEGIVLIDTSDGSMVDCNPQFESLTGRTIDQLKELKIWEIRPPDIAKKAKRKFFEVIKQGSGYTGDLEIQRPNGETVPIEFTSKVLQIRNKKYIQSIVRDVTERRKLEQQLRSYTENLEKRVEEKTSELRNLSETMQSILQAAKDFFIFTFNQHGIITSMNEGTRSIIGFEKDELVEKKPVSAFHPGKDTASAWQHKMIRAVTNSGKYEKELRLRRKNNQVFPAHLIIRPMNDPLTSGQSYLCIGQDITSQRAIQEELLRSAKLAASGQLAASIAHEINNPLYGIKNTLEILAEQIAGHDYSQKLVSLSLQEIDRVKNLLWKLLDLYKPHPDKEQTFEINALLENILIFMEPQIYKANATLTTDFENTPLTMLGSPDQIQQVFMNLITNSLNAMPHGGDLSIVTRKMGRRIIVEVADSG
ncbi:hypothetical protein AMJ86_03730, partial [bacterium SM23_57]